MRACLVKTLVLARKGQRFDPIWGRKIISTSRESPKYIYRAKNSISINKKLPKQNSTIKKIIVGITKVIGLTPFRFEKEKEV